MRYYYQSCEIVPPYSANFIPFKENQEIEAVRGSDNHNYSASQIYLSAESLNQARYQFLA